MRHAFRCVMMVPVVSQVYPAALLHHWSAAQPSECLSRLGGANQLQDLSCLSFGSRYSKLWHSDNQPLRKFLLVRLEWVSLDTLSLKSWALVQASVTQGHSHCAWWSAWKERFLPSCPRQFVWGSAYESNMIHIRAVCLLPFRRLMNVPYQIVCFFGHDFNYDKWSPAWPQLADVRSLHTDFLLTILRELLQRRTDLKLVLMSSAKLSSLQQEFLVLLSRGCGWSVLLPPGTQYGRNHHGEWRGQNGSILLSCGASAFWGQRPCSRVFSQTILVVPRLVEGSFCRSEAANF